MFLSWQPFLEIGFSPWLSGPSSWHLWPPEASHSWFSTSFWRPHCLAPGLASCLITARSVCKPQFFLLSRFLVAWERSSRWVGETRGPDPRDGFFEGNLITIGCLVIKDQIHSPVPWVLITLEPTHWCQTPVLPMLSICTKRFVRSAIGVSSIVAAFNHLVKNNSLGICFPLDITKYVNLSPKRDVVWSQTRCGSIRTVQRLPRKSRSWKSVML